MPRDSGRSWNLESNEAEEGKRDTMKVIVDLCVVPIGVGVSVSEYVTACERVLNKAGLKTFMHAYGTNIEGEWEEVFAAVECATRPCTPWEHHGYPRPFASVREPTARRLWKRRWKVLSRN